MSINFIRTKQEHPSPESYLRDYASKRNIDEKFPNLSLDEDIRQMKSVPVLAQQCHLPIFIFAPYSTSTVYQVLLYCLYLSRFDNTGQQFTELSTMLYVDFWPSALLRLERHTLLLCLLLTRFSSSWDEA
ncbi:hypothetical protein NECAME_07394 [Necator americanus]|uniref:Uncharacterized protein n=1 Tax=Necator americanus TaxID=51031 RepID=W2TMQ3_NECAM|nr:hypothetical protein NECAME_07394 [Necator americanus]ETN83385.1 hypothetical protein NECAME_07394 [Necator americanus]